MIPAALLMYRKRASQYLPSRVGGYLTHLTLGAFGWACNAMMVAWALVSLEFFDLPAAVPVKGLTMNYTSAVLGATEMRPFCYRDLARLRGSMELLNSAYTA